MFLLAKCLRWRLGSDCDFAPANAPPPFAVEIGDVLKIKYYSVFDFAHLIPSLEELRIASRFIFSLLSELIL